MSLPNGFDNPTKYFRCAVDFLWQNSWIFREANTMFLRAGILDHMPQDYKNYFLEVDTDQLNKFPYVHETLPQLNQPTLVDFRHKLAKLIPREAYAEAKDMSIQTQQVEHLKRMNIKKQHEIQRLAAVINYILKLNHCDGGRNSTEYDDEHQSQRRQKCVLIDFGSGLGYLSESLYKLNRNILILGIESDPYRVQAAEKRIQTYHPNGTNSIHYRQHFITENSNQFITQTIEELSKLNYQQVPQQITTRMALIGLHACADLTITSMKLFLQMPQVQHLIIMPCCYHKLQVCDGCAADVGDSATALKFRNFPISECLKQVLLEHDSLNYGCFTSYLNRPFLRLACQQTLKRWGKCSQLEHLVHGNEMFLRALAESIKLTDEETELVVVKCREAKIDLRSLDVEQLKCFEIFSQLYVLKRRTTNEVVVWSESHREKFNKIVQKYPNGGTLAEGLTCLQTSMQKLCENLVLYDRLCYMQETALELQLAINVRYEKIMDEELSPRCYVLIAEKL